MVVISLAVGGFSAIPFARQKFDRYFRALGGLPDKIGIWVVRVVCVFMCVEKLFVHINSFRMRVVCWRAALSCGGSADCNVRELRQNFALPIRVCI